MRVATVPACVVAVETNPHDHRENYTAKLYTTAHGISSIPMLTAESARALGLRLGETVRIEIHTED